VADGEAKVVALLVGDVAAEAYGPVAMLRNSENKAREIHLCGLLIINRLRSGASIIGLWALG
jgi:hypothetical protein